MHGYEMSNYENLNNLRHLGRANPVFDATRARKKAEQDSILLANRIRLLRAEDARTRKKIVETEKKTQEILMARQRNEQRRHEKEVFDAQKEVMEQDFRSRQMVERLDQQNKILDKKREIQEKNAMGGHALRKQRQAHRQVLDLERQASADEAFARAEQVRVAMDRAAQSRARSEDAKQELAKDVLRERMLREEDERRLRLQEIDRMEREEAELLQRLHRSQERHRMAYLQLEDVLRGASPLPDAHIAPAAIDTATPSSSSRRNEVESRESRDSRPESRSSKPPLPRLAAPPIRAPPQVRAPPGARPCSAQRHKAKAGVSTSGKSRIDTPPDAVDQLRQKHSLSAMSNASTASMGESIPAEGSGPSVSSSAPQIRYTTVDGIQLDIPAEEDLDLAALLNGR